MDKNRYEFILELLESKKLTDFQKERILKLSSEELIDSSLLGSDVLLRLEKIEKNLGLYVEDDISDDEHLKDLEKHPYFDPNNLSLFLECYNQGTILKTTCHEIDEEDLLKILELTGQEEYNYDAHYNLILTEFEKFSELFIHWSITNTIRLYLTGKTFKGKKAKVGWAENIPVNWNCDDLRTWLSLNPNLPPNPDTIMRRKKRYNGFTFEEIPPLGINTFSDLVIHFKRLYHIRYDNALRDIVERINKENGWNDLIEFKTSDDDFTRDVEFFTDVTKVKSIYCALIEMILEVANKKKQDKPVVRLSLTNDQTSYVFSIHHINSRFTKDSDNVIKKLGKSHTNLITNYLLGACDLYLKAEFGTGESGTINLWNKKRTARTFTPEPFKGVEHQLKFVK